MNRIAAFLRTQDKISALMVLATKSLKAGIVEKFCKLLETFLLSKFVRYMQASNEAMLEAILTNYEYVRTSSSQ